MRGAELKNVTELRACIECRLGEGLFIKAVGGSSCHLELGAGQLQSFKEWLERERGWGQCPKSPLGGIETEIGERQKFKCDIQGAAFLLAMVGSASEPPLPEAG